MCTNLSANNSVINEKLLSRWNLILDMVNNRFIFEQQKLTQNSNKKLSKLHHSDTTVKWFLNRIFYENYNSTFLEYLFQLMMLKKMNINKDPEKHWNSTSSILIICDHDTERNSESHYKLCLCFLLNALCMHILYIKLYQMDPLAGWLGFNGQHPQDDISTKQMDNETTLDNRLIFSLDLIDNYQRLWLSKKSV